MKKAHFIGICGVGMAGTAQILKQAGWRVTGSDEGFYPPMNEFLARANIQFHRDYKAENIPDDADTIVVGKNAKLVPETNEEVRAAYNSGARVVSFAEIIGELVAEKENVVVAGSYGKSTITAILTHVLSHAQKDPAYFVGAVPIKGDATARMGSRSICILEGDEYPSSNTDSRSKFLHYHPRDVLLTSAAHDHVNVFPTLKEYLAPFRELLASVPAEGKIVACIDAPNVADVVGSRTNIITYGLSENASWWPAHIQYGEHTTFDLMRNGSKATTLYTTLLGAHNIQNIVGASAMLLERGLVSPDELARGIRDFSGIKRRLEKRTRSTDVAVYEDFGSSYEKMRAGIEALKVHFPDRRKVLVFEPHTFSWRNRDALAWYDSAFEGADEIFVYRPASQGASTHKQLSHDEIVSRLQKAGFSVQKVTDAERGLKGITETLRPKDVVLCSTSGDLGGLIPHIAEFAEGTFPQK